jgi:hypothetical protein
MVGMLNFEYLLIISFSSAQLCAPTKSKQNRRMSTKERKANTKNPGA